MAPRGDVTPVRIWMVNTESVAVAPCADPRRRGRLRRRRANRRRARHARAGAHRVPRHRRVDLRKPAADRAPRRRRQRRARHLRRQRHAGGVRRGRGRRAHRLRGPRRDRGRTRRPARAGRVDPPRGRAPDEPRRRDRQDRAQDEPARPGDGTAGRVTTRTFIPHRVHEAIGVFGAVSVATACLVPGSVAQEVSGLDDRRAGEITLDIEHPTGYFSVSLDVDVAGRRRHRAIGVAAAHRPTAHARRGVRPVVDLGSR